MLEEELIKEKLKELKQQSIYEKLRIIERELKKEIKDYHVYAFLFGFFIGALPIPGALSGLLLSGAYWLLPRPPEKKEEYYLAKSIGLGLAYLVFRKIMKR